MTKELRSRARFLMELVADFNDSHEGLRASFRMDEDSINIAIRKEHATLMYDFYYLKDLTEELVYMTYKKMNAVTEQSTASDDAPQNMNVTEE